MRRWAPTALLIVATASPMAGCASGGGDREPVRSGARALGEWVGLWKGDIRTGAQHPPHLDIPAPPRIVLAGVAESIGAEVASASGPLAGLRERVHDETADAAAEYTKSTMCNWFAWYVEDQNHTIPDSAAFERILLKAGFEVVFPDTPPPQQVREASELFRNAIVRAKGDPDAEHRNEAIAAACSIPLPRA